jgi:hypothetical protein
MLTHHNFPHTDSYLRFRFFFAFAVRTLAAALDALMASSLRCSRVIWANLALPPFFPIMEK